MRANAESRNGVNLEHRTQKNSKTQDTTEIPTALHQDPNWKSALEVVVLHEMDEFVNIDSSKQTVFQQLIEEKWNGFAYRWHIVRELLPFAIFAAISTSAALYRVAAVWERHVGPYYDSDTSTWARTLAPSDTPETYQSISEWLHCVLFVLGIPFLLLRAWDERRLDILDLDPNEDHDYDFVEYMFFLYKNLAMLLNLAIAALLGAQGMIWAIDDGYRQGIDLIAWEHESRIMALAVLFTWLKCLHLLLPFQAVGPLLVTVWRMFMSDITKWLIVYIFVLVAFSTATEIIVHKNYILHRDNPLDTARVDLEKQKVVDGDYPYVPFGQMLSYVFVMMGEVAHTSVTTAGFSQPDQKLIHVVYNIIATLLLQNLIIAMMGDTYARERQNEGYAMWWMNHAHLVLKYERALHRCVCVCVCVCVRERERERERESHLRPARALHRHTSPAERIRHRSGSDISRGVYVCIVGSTLARSGSLVSALSLTRTRVPGSDHPECRPFFTVYVGPADAIEVTCMRERLRRVHV